LKSKSPLKGKSHLMIRRLSLKFLILFWISDYMACDVCLKVPSTEYAVNIPAQKQKQLLTETFLFVFSSLLNINR
jgi:hypothetical protein